MNLLRFVNALLLTSCIASLEACSDESPAKSGTGGAGGAGTVTTGATTTTGTTTTGAGGDTGSTTTTTTTGTTGTGGTGTGTDMPSPLPFVVDSLFVASGYMGDGSSPGAIMQDDNMTCAASRPMGAVGHCHKFTYTPVIPDAGAGWGGVYWQYPVNNWGAMPGKRIAQGATKITFVASGAKGGESVKFIAGGITGMANNDTLNASVSVVLTTTPTPYIIDLTAQTYDAVLGGFGWTIDGMGSTAPVSFTVDNIRWEQ